jgi:hypothetical protein
MSAGIVIQRMTTARKFLERQHAFTFSEPLDVSRGAIDAEGNSSEFHKKFPRNQNILN